MAALLAAGALACGWAAPASTAQTGVSGPRFTGIPPSPRVTVALLPFETTLQDLARISGLSIGLMSAGIGEVPSEQTFLDASQGARVDEELYDRDLPGLFPFAREVPGWAEAVERADAAPADLTPGLLAERLRSAGIRALAQQPMSAPAILAADERGVVAPLRPGEFARSRARLAVVEANAGALPGLVRGLRGDDLLIALVSPPPDPDRALPIAIAGRGFDGNLTSDSTRTDGYVLSTDLAPTILDRFGLPVPDAMDGEPIRGEGAADPGAVEHLADRMAVIPDRRAPVLIACLAAWIVLALAANRIVFGLRRVAIAWLGLAFAYMPLMLLAGAWLEPGAIAEGLVIGVGAGVLAALTVRFASGWRGLALACAITLIAYAVDMVAGSGLTRLSLLGPNPIYGVRFYGIGNELEALIAVMVPVGVGAGLSAYSGSGRRVTRRRAVLAFLSLGAVATVAFAAGRFGADVGAAIVLPVGTAVAAASLPAGDIVEFSAHSGEKSTKRAWRRPTLAAICAPFIALVALALIDLVSGGNAHLTRSVLDAGGAGDLADVAQRRLELSAQDFTQAARNPLFWLLVAGICGAIAKRRRFDAWLRPVPAARAGFLGACSAVAVGVLVNDSGATFLALGALALGPFLAYAWSQARMTPDPASESGTEEGVTAATKERGARPVP